MSAIICLNRLIQEDFASAVRPHLDHVVTALMAAMSSPSQSRRRFLAPAICTGARELAQREPCIAFHPATCRLAYGLRRSADLAVYDVGAGQFWKVLEAPSAGEHALRLSGYMHVAVNPAGDHVAALARGPRREDDFVLCCWCLSAHHKQWVGNILGILGDGGDRIGCKWYQHVLVPGWTAADAVAVSWSADEDAILIARNGEVGQVVANE